MSDTLMCHWCEKDRTEDQFEGEVWFETPEDGYEVCSVCVEEDFMHRLREREGEFYWMTDAAWKAAKRKAGIA